MGTRGTYGVRIEDVDKLMYNHFDSYPSGLGFDILSQTKNMIGEKGISWMKKQASLLEMVDENSTPTKKQKEILKEYADLGVGRQTSDDWYCLTRKIQGKLALTLEVGIAVDGGDFIGDSLFCEYGYILNLDEETLEVYKGFQKKKHNKGRFSKRPVSNGYYACALVAEFSLDKLPTEEDFLKGVK